VGPRGAGPEAWVSAFVALLWRALHPGGAGGGGGQGPSPPIPEPTPQKRRSIPTLMVKVGIVMFTARFALGLLGLVFGVMLEVKALSPNPFRRRNASRRCHARGARVCDGEIGDWLGARRVSTTD